MVVVFTRGGAIRSVLRMLSFLFLVIKDYDFRNKHGIILLTDNYFCPPLQQNIII